MSTENEKARISCKPNGPLLVKFLDSLQNSKGENIPTKSAFALCRCGHSENKPFCDGTHRKIGFSGEKTSQEAKSSKKSYMGKQLTLHDNRSICAHAGICTDQLPSVFRMKEEPWIDPDGAEVEKIIEIVNQCPSGALRCTIEDAEPQGPDQNPVIQISKNGPYFVKGGVELEEIPEAEFPSGEHYALCRCGQSKNKPFCDGTHWSADFKDDAN
ncbi:MAG: CDGSH iron-sulfur domain-containing protein [SAR324 cluster bacterium]|nr:CDGSH iron-sulfur domain-containing protein [SAR324 cluster bacterium]